MALTPEQRRLLTPKQRRLCTEIEDIASMVDTDHWKILDYKPSARTSRLEVAKNRLIRGHVIAMYTFVDQLLTLAIWRYYFYESSKKKPLTQRWRMKKFRTFHHLMEATSLQSKLYRVPEIVTLGRLPGEGESDSRWRTKEVRHVGSDTLTPGF